MKRTAIIIACLLTAFIIVGCSNPTHNDDVYERPVYSLEDGASDGNTATDDQQDNDTDAASEDDAIENGLNMEHGHKVDLR